MFTLGDMGLLAGVGLACLYFLSALRVRELATQAVSLASRRDDFQLHFCF